MSESEKRIHDVLVIGGGPCGLAVAARLCENTPSSVFTDAAHQRYYRFKASTSRRGSKPSRVGSEGLKEEASDLESHHGLDIAVVDAHGDKWMSGWHQRFKNLRISHLRSPMFFHPDPRDRDGLLSFAYRSGREGELKEIHGVIGKALSKQQRNKKKGSKSTQQTTYLDERDRPDFFRPSQALFKDYCLEIAERYGISNVVENAEVSAIEYEHPNDESPHGFFTVETSTGTKYARIVVLAIGPALKPRLPPNSPFLSTPSGSATHALINPHLPPHVLAKIAGKKHTSVLVVGGGLTSAQITHSFLSHGVTKIYHLLRGPLKVKDFDVGLEWVAQRANYFFSQFYNADSDQEREEMIREARNGGSVNAEYEGILRSYEKAGKLMLKERTEVTGAEWDEQKMRWLVKAGDMEMVVDHVVYATGVQTDVKDVQMLKGLFEKEEIQVAGGLPCINGDCMWKEGVPFFVSGRLAGLRLGPAAGNLVGAKQGAERIAGKIEELLERMKGGEGSDSGYDSAGSGRVDGRTLGLGLTNQFGVLGLQSEDEEDESEDE